MPLKDHAERELLHTRKVTCEGYLRKDGLWDIEAILEDSKTYEFSNEHRGGSIKPAEPLHGMCLRVTLDDDYRIHDVDASLDWTPFAICPSAVEEMKKLIGLSIGPGWMGLVKQAIRNTSRCTHLVELLPHVATAAYQTMHYKRYRQAQQPTDGNKPRMIDSCVALVSDGDVVKDRWPDFYTGDKDSSE